MRSNQLLSRRRKLRTVLLLIALFGALPRARSEATVPATATATAVAPEATNKAVVRAFYDLAFNRHQPAEAMKLYGGEKYVQHNPFVADGVRPFVDYFSGFFPKNPESSAEIKRAIAEGDLVVLHVNSKLNKNDRGRAVIDIFRVANGKIVEHWDVAQPIPEKAANSNTMF